MSPSARQSDICCFKVYIESRLRSFSNEKQIQDSLDNLISFHPIPIKDKYDLSKREYTSAWVGR